MPDQRSPVGIWAIARRYVPRALPYLRPYRGLLALTALLTMLGTAMMLAEPWPLAFLVDTVLTDAEPPALITRLFGADKTRLILVAVVAGFAITLLSNGFHVLTSYVLVRLEQRMVLDLRSDLFGHVQRLSLAFHDDQRKGRLLFAINDQASAVGDVLTSVIPLTQALLTLVGMLVIALKISPALALTALSVTPLVYLSTALYGRRISPYLRHVRGLEGRSMSIVHEAMSMMKVIVAFGRERYEHHRFREQGSEAVDGRIRVTVAQTAFSLGVNVITAVGTALVLGVGAHQVLRGNLTVGGLLVVVSYIASVYKPLEQISTTVAQLQERLITLEAAVRLLDRVPDVADSPDAQELEKVTGHVGFRDVTYAYQGRKNALESVNLDVEAGHTVGIVGHTGAGKSTLLGLIPRFFDATKGSVEIDGVDVRQLTLESLRRHISIVLQDPLLFRGSIADNIRYGRLDASMDEVVRAAEAANAHEFISALDDGYDTVVGEGGTKLSGGERQRISIARAFLRDAPILLLDEPTSSVDSQTEAVILDALQRLTSGRTTFMVAHRLSTLRRADLIVVLDHGRVVQTGTHAELTVAQGPYRDVYEVQHGLERAAAPVSPVTVVDAVSDSVVRSSNGDGGTPQRRTPKRHRQPPRPVLPNGERNKQRPYPSNGVPKLDLNVASAEDLVCLPGIGPKLAQEIVARREEIGGFTWVRQLLWVRGISEARLEELSPYLAPGPLKPPAAAAGNGTGEPDAGAPG
ncbi:MAG: ATP-binding cassette domain-containing protein [Actinobacteria bacterium]|nr:ATP-binding cassette domain-containing protein [Actinomycetota bacterium]